MSFLVAFMIIGSGILNAVRFVQHVPDPDVHTGSFIPLAHAEDKEQAKEGAGEGDRGGQGPFGALGAGVGGVVSGLASIFLKIFSGLLWFVLYWIGPLMDNTFILEGDIGEKIRSVWIIVRNFVNIFFALALVVVAFMAVIGYGEESGNYAIKKFIPKLALALIAVNFTFLACKLVLDVNNVLTTAVFAIPQSVTNLSDIAPTGADGQMIFRKLKCFDQEKNFDDQLKKSKALEEKYKGVIAQLGGICFATPPTDNWNGKGIDGSTGQEIISFSSTGLSKKDFVWAMATQFQGIQNLNLVSQLVDSRSFTNLTVNAIFSMIFAVIYGTAYVAMFIILLGRMIVLWITIMLSPLVAISIVIPDILPQELNIKDKFLSHAFVPLKMAIPLSFGYILISQMTLALDVGSNIIQENTLDLSQGGEFARDISFTTLLYGAASVGVIWMAVFMASKDVVGSGLVEKLKGTMESAGSTVAKWPAYIPFMPVPGGHASLEGIRHIFHTAKETIAEGRRKSDESLARETISKWGLNRDLYSEAKNELMRMIDKKEFNPDDFRKHFQKISGDDRHFAEVSKALASVTDKPTQNVIVSMTGKKDFAEYQHDVNSSVKLGEMQEKVRSGAGAGVGGGKTAKDYEKFNDGFASLSATFKSTTSYSDETKKTFAIPAKGEKNVPVGNFSTTKFFDWFKKSSYEDRNAFLKDNDTFVTLLIEHGSFSPFKADAQDDGDLRNALRRSFLAGNTEDIKKNNSAVFSLYSALFTTPEKDNAALKKELTDAKFEFS